MKLLACQNCWFNGIQYGSVGLPVGYCTRHRNILNLADETTCGQHIRKDLGLSRALQVAELHAKNYDSGRIVRISTNEEVQADTSVSVKDLDVLRDDNVGDAVLDYGFLNSKIASIAQLKSIQTPRADIAMSSLGRAYVHNCVAKGGKWTSGVHIYWWTRNRIAQIPELKASDLRYSGSIQISRQAELAEWSIMMLRLYLLDDIAAYAHKDDDLLGREHGVANWAASSVQIFNIKKLSKWIRKELLPYLDGRLDRSRYYAIANELKKETASPVEAD